MAIERLTISLDADLAADLRGQAAAEQVSVSAWVADSIAIELRHRGLAAVMADFENEHGAFTEDELGAARRRLGW